MEENTEQEPVTETGKSETSPAAEEPTKAPEEAPQTQEKEPEETPKTDGEEKAPEEAPKTDEQEAAPENTEQPTEQPEVPTEGQPTPEQMENIPPPISDPGADPEEPEVDFQIHALKSGDVVVKYEMTLGDILTCTLLAALILILLVNFFHRLILGGKPK